MIIVTNVGSINALVLGSNFGQGDNFIGFGKSTWNINQTCGQAQSSIFHGFGHQLLHLGQLLGAGCPIDRAHHFATDGVVPCQCAYIGGDAEFFQFLKKGIDVFCRTATVARNQRSHAVEEEIGRTGIALNAAFDMGMNIDKTWADDFSCSINDLRSSSSAQTTHGGDFSVAYPNIDLDPRLTRAIYQQAVSDEYIKIHLRGQHMYQHKAGEDA